VGDGVALEPSMRAPLAVGLFVHAEIAGHLARDVVVVPRSAIRSGNQILVVDDGDRLRHRAVDVLRIDREDVLIHVDISPSERIVVSPIQVVVDGMKVRTLGADAEPSA